MDIDTACNILRVDKDASPSEIEAAFKKMVRRYPPEFKPEKFADKLPVFGPNGRALGAVWAAINSDNDAYRDASPYFKGTHLVVPWGNKIIVVPKPFELGMGFTAGEYAYHAMAQKDPRAGRIFLDVDAVALANLDIAQDDFKRGAIEGVWI